MKTQREVRFQPNALIESLETTIKDLAERDASQRIWSQDHTLWQQDPMEISNRLDWLFSPREMESRIEELETFTSRLKEDGFTHVLWCGMGGSSLFPMVLMQAFGSNENGLEMRVLDTSNPVTVRRVADQLPLERTLLVFASKSGGTIETRSQLDFFWDKVPHSDRFTVVTDPGSELEKLAVRRRFRQVYRNNPNIGGRYSALSHYGIVPAALLGIDIAQLLHHTGLMTASTAPSVSASDNPALRLGALLATAVKAGRDKCTLILPPEISRFGGWLEQLIAESTGKNGTGVLPVADEELGPPKVYGDDRFFISLGVEEGLEELAAAGHPVVIIDYDEPFNLGEEVFRWEFATAVSGAALGVNPFDQPNVEAAKRATGKILVEGLPDIPIEPTSQMLERINPGNYIAIQAYVDVDSPNINALQRTRLMLRDKYRVATTLGLGPRYLHSTGQFHKGGPPTGVFLQVVDDTEPDLSIPGKSYGFSDLMQAQAAGDYMALKQSGMRVARVSMKDLSDFDIRNQ